MAAATPQATPHRNVLAQTDLGSQPAARGLLQQARGAHGEVLIGRNTLNLGGPKDLAIGTHTHVDSVSPVDQLEDALEQVIAIGAATCDMQEAIDLGRRRSIPDLAAGPLGRGQDKSEGHGCFSHSGS
jgi:hypothetical protein